MDDAVRDMMGKNPPGIPSELARARDEMYVAQQRFDASARHLGETVLTHGTDDMVFYSALGIARGHFRRLIEASGRCSVLEAEDTIRRGGATHE